jgi:hypothetical protein
MDMLQVAFQLKARAVDEKKQNQKEFQSIQRTKLTGSCS